MSADPSHRYFPNRPNGVSFNEMHATLLEALVGDHSKEAYESRLALRRYFNDMGEDSPMRIVDGMEIVPTDAAEEAMRRLIAEWKEQAPSTPTPDEATRPAPTEAPYPKGLRNRLLIELGDKNDEANTLEAEIEKTQARLRRVRADIDALCREVEALSPGLFTEQPKHSKKKKKGTKGTTTLKTTARPLTDMEIAALKAAVGCPLRLGLLEDYLGGTLALLPRHSASEIRKNCPGVGPKTIARINETLAEIGLRLVEK